MADFIALYRGRTVAEAELVAISAEQGGLVRRFFAELLGEPETGSDDREAERRSAALEVVRDE